MEQADVIIHIDEAIDHDRRAQIVAMVRSQAGVASVVQPDARPHLMSVRYDPKIVSAHALLDAVRHQGVHAELVGL
jgi:hypothetical protein